MNINQKVSEILEVKFPDSIIKPEEPHNDFIQISSEQWKVIAQFLKTDSKLYFDSCQCITGVDLGLEQELEVRYNFHSMKFKHNIEIRIAVERKKPSIPSVEQIWRIADWFEREVFDMYGIRFKGHRDLRRMLLPDDWKGWPLRKDYKTPNIYNGMKVPKVRKGWD
ncbi:MAG: NADH-quinone oxidoreductase subunit C [Candidatus Neomarinimicrobiota bacterium]